MEKDILDELMELMPRGGRQREGDGGKAYVMHRLYQAGSLSPTELRRELSVSGPRVTAILNELEDKGFVRRETAAEDRRGVAVTLTEAGRAEVERRREYRRRRLQRLTDRIGPEDARALARILRAAKELEREDGDDHPHRHERHD